MRRVDHYGLRCSVFSVMEACLLGRRLPAEEIVGEAMLVAVFFILLIRGRAGDAGDATSGGGSAGGASPTPKPVSEVRMPSTATSPNPPRMRPSLRLR